MFSIISLDQMAASLAGLYGGGYGQSQEDGSGGRSGFFRTGGKKCFGGVPIRESQPDQPLTQQQQPLLTIDATDLALNKV